jgi:hypothetical protein
MYGILKMMKINYGILFYYTAKAAVILLLSSEKGKNGKSRKEKWKKPKNESAANWSSY